MENNITIEETNDEKGDVTVLSRRPGRPPKNPIKNLFYWIDVTIIILFKSKWLLLGIIGGFVGYYNGNVFEMIIVGIIVGAVSMKTNYLVEKMVCG